VILDGFGPHHSSAKRLMVRNMTNAPKVLVTGTAGFIGFHLVKRLLAQGDHVVGLDNINAYYDVGLKYARLEQTGIPRDAIQDNRLIQSETFPGYRFIKLDLEDTTNIFRLFQKQNFTQVCHLAAQAGVRYSLENPHSYISSNIFGFLNILEGCRHNHVQHLVFASSSSVYGLNEKLPFSTKDQTDHPTSPYGASKKSNELFAHSYSHLYHLPATGLRFFTVYGPWGRPDMALFKFTEAILQDKPIDVYSEGRMTRDFTYVDDIVEGICRVLPHPPQADPTWSGLAPDSASSRTSYRIYNIGNSRPVQLMDFIDAIQKALGKSAKLRYLPPQPGDVVATFADMSGIQRDFGDLPHTSIEEGIRRFLEWYRNYYGTDKRL